MGSTTTMIVSPTHGRFIFDAVFTVDHSANLTVTQHQVQSGSSISDHAYMEPDEVNISIGMTDVAANAADENHSVNAYAQLRAIMESRKLLTLVTRLKVYQNMLITSMSAPEEVKTQHALRSSIYFQQVEIVSASTVTVQETVTSSKTTSTSSSSKSSGDSAAKTSSTTTTTKSTSSASQSVLNKIASALGL